MATTFKRTSLCLCLGLLTAVRLGPARAADEINLVEILRAAMRNSGEMAVSSNQVQTLAPGDTLQLTVYQEDDLNLKGAVIAKDGTISHPLLGAISVAGKTLEEAEKLIHDILLKDYLVRPQVSLTLNAYAKYRITVINEVVRPDTFEVSRTNTLTLTDAITLAGGPTRLGNLSRVSVVRVVDGQKEEHRLDADSREGREFVIRPDDVIEVPSKGR